jgi:hypothetical protein
MNSLCGREMDSGYHAQASRGWNAEILLSKIVENSRKNSWPSVKKLRFRMSFILGKGGKVGVPSHHPLGMT